MVAIASKLGLVVVLLLTVSRSNGENHLENDSSDLQTTDVGKVDLDSADDIVEGGADEDADAAEEQEDPRAWWSSSSRRRPKTGPRPPAPRRRPQPGGGGSRGFLWRRKPQPKRRPRPPVPRPRPRPPRPPAPRPRPQPGGGGGGGGFWWRRKPRPKPRPRPPVPRPRPRPPRPPAPRPRPQPGGGGGGGGFWWRRKPRPKPRPRPPGPPAPKPRPRPGPRPGPGPGPGPRPPAPSGGSCSITTYRGSNFRNSARVERGFLGGMNRINGYAGACNVQIHVTSSFRSWGASTSNHKVGHAIDMNVIDRGAWCTWGSGCLTKPPARFSGVRCFIAIIRGEFPNLRWGGDFKKVDPVHIDDGLNIYNRPLYDRLLASCRRVG